MFSGSLILLAACQINPPQNNTKWQPERDWQAFAMSGRIGVKIADKGSYANFDWTYQNRVQTIDINTPIGTTVGQLCQDSEGVLAVDNHNRIFQADSVAQLSEQLLGYELPLDNFAVWANGEYVKKIPYHIENSGNLIQAGWQISRETDENGNVKLLELNNEKLNVRLAFSEVARTAGLPEKSGRCAAREQEKSDVAQ